MTVGRAPELSVYKATLSGALPCRPKPTLTSLDSRCRVLNSRMCWALLRSPYLHCGLETLQAASWSLPKSRLICFPSLRAHCPSFTESQCFESCRLVFSVISRRRVNLMPVCYSSLARNRRQDIYAFKFSTTPIPHL